MLANVEPELADMSPELADVVPVLADFGPTSGRNSQADRKPLNGRDEFNFLIYTNTWIIFSTPFLSPRSSHWKNSNIKTRDLHVHYSSDIAKYVFMIDYNDMFSKH